MNRSLACTMIAVFGLLTLSGSGCSDKDDKAAMQAALLRDQMAAREKEMNCKVAALARVCSVGDTACEKARNETVAACNMTSESSSGSSSATNTNTSTNTNTNTGGGGT